MIVVTGVASGMLSCPRLALLPLYRQRVCSLAAGFRQPWDLASLWCNVVGPMGLLRLFSYFLDAEPIHLGFIECRELQRLIKTILRCIISLLGLLLSDKNCKWPFFLLFFFYQQASCRRIIFFVGFYRVLFNLSVSALDRCKWICIGQEQYQCLSLVWTKVY